MLKYNLLFFTKWKNNMFLKFSSNKLNSSRHKIYHSSNGTNNKKIKKFYINIKRNFFRSQKKHLVIRGRLKTLQKRSVLENNIFFFNNMPAVCIDFTFDKRKTAYSAFISFANGVSMYIKSPHGYYIGDCIKIANIDITYVWIFMQDSFYIYHNKNYKIGYVVNITFLKKKTMCFNFLHKYARSGGTYCIIKKKQVYSDVCKISLPSGKKIKYLSNNYIMVGRCSNPSNKRMVVGSAGNAFKKGFKSITRGVAMNPVDHPNGGRTKTCKPMKNLWGKIAKKSK